MDFLKHLFFLQVQLMHHDLFSKNERTTHHDLHILFSGSFLENHFTCLRTISSVVCTKSLWRLILNKPVLIVVLYIVQYASYCLYNVAVDKFYEYRKHFGDDSEKNLEKIR